MTQRIVSADKSLVVTTGPGGLEVVILGHYWHWIVKVGTGELVLFGSYAPPGSGHNTKANKPVDCPGCLEFSQAAAEVLSRQRTA